MTPRPRPALTALVAALVTVAAGVVVAPTAGATPSGDPRGAFHSYETPNPPGAPGESVISLTFDDGPHPVYTPQILDILARYGVKATFFELGREAEKHPEIVKRIVAEGHVIANHSYDHANLKNLSDERFIFEVDHTTDVLQSISGQHIDCLRPPYGASNPQLVGRLGDRALTSVLWTADSRDFEKPGAAAIAQNAIAHLQPGGIILFHDGGGVRDQTIAALPTIIEHIINAGYRIAPVCPPDLHIPVGGLNQVEGQPYGRIDVGGWATDPDTKDPIAVHLELDGAFIQDVMADRRGSPGPAYQTTIPARPGHHEVCAFALNAGPGSTNPSLGCAATDVPAVTAFDDLHVLAEKARFGQIREQARVLQRVVQVHQARRRPWRIGSTFGLGRQPIVP